MLRSIDDNGDFAWLISAQYALYRNARIVHRLSARLFSLFFTDRAAIAFYTHSDTVRATAYTHTDKGCDTITATGTTVRWGTVAVDPRYIPYGTRMFIVASDGSYIYGLATAEDCGGDIKGDRMDLYMPTYEQCREFGRRRCTLYFLG